MIGIGVYGALSTAKYFERWFRHWRRAYAYEAHLHKKFPEIDANLNEQANEVSGSIDDVFEAAIDKRFPRLTKVQIYRLWASLHWGVAVAGGLLTVVAVFVWSQ